MQKWEYLTLVASRKRNGNDVNREWIIRYNPDNAIQIKDTEVLHMPDPKVKTTRRAK